MGVTVRFSISSSINGSDETHICESLRLNRISWIKDELPRFYHVAREEETHEMFAV